MKLRKKPVVKIIKPDHAGSEPESKENRRGNPESEIKKTVESWIREFRRSAIDRDEHFVRTSVLTRASTR